MGLIRQHRLKTAAQLGGHRFVTSPGQDNETKKPRSMKDMALGLGGASAVLATGAMLHHRPGRSSANLAPRTAELMNAGKVARGVTRKPGLLSKAKGFAGRMGKGAWRAADVLSDVLLYM